MFQICQTFEVAQPANPLDIRGGAEAAAESKSGGIDVGLLIYFALWYLGNYYVSILIMVKLV